MSATPLRDGGVPTWTPPDDFAEDVDVEMTNLGRTYTNIPGVIAVSSRLGAHGPRVKWYAASPVEEDGRSDFWAIQRICDTFRDVPRLPLDD